MFKKILTKLHWLIGITLGLVMLIMGTTGALLSFQDEISAALNSDQTKVSAPSDTAMPNVADVLTELRQRQAQVPTQLINFSDRELIWEIGFADGKRVQWFDLNPYDLSLRPQQRRGEAFFEAVEDLHRRLMLGDEGKLLTGISTLTLIYLALSGLYLRWPRSAASLKQWLGCDARLKGRGFWRQLHVALGTWVLLPFLLIALTGLFWSFDWYRNGLFQITGAERPAPRAPAANVSADTVAARFNAAAYQSISEQIAQHIPHYSRLQWRFPLQENQPIEIRYLTGAEAHRRASNVLQLDAQNFTVLKHERYDELSTGSKIMRSIFVLHSGQFFGWPGMLAMFIASLSLPFFFITGWWLYLKRRAR